VLAYLALHALVARRQLLDAAGFALRRR
jgi:hypothetical protein